MQNNKISARVRRQNESLEKREARLDAIRKAHQIRMQNES
jgi:hypothetical protein